MSTYLTMTQDLASLLVAATLVGLAVRHRLRFSRAFVAYLISVLAWNALFRWSPARFWTPENWILMNASYAALRALLAIELTVLILEPVPRARATALAVLLMILLWLAWPRPVAANAYIDFAGTLAPRLSMAGLWMLATVAFFAAMYRTHLAPLHRDILVGFGLYLSVSAMLLSGIGLVAASRPAYLQASAFLNLADPLVYLASVGVWVWSAWRPDPNTGSSPWATSH
jgi:hypothetical protein